MSHCATGIARGRDSAWTSGEEALTGLLDWVIPPARAANGLAIGNIQICVENGEYRLSGLSIIDDNDGDDRVVVGCESWSAAMIPGRSTAHPRTCSAAMEPWAPSR